MCVHEAAHDHEAENDLKDYKDVVYQVHWELMRELNRLNYRHDTERHDEENCENGEGYQFRELIKV